MVKQVTENSCLYQDEAATAIEHNFGRNFVYDNENGNPAISKDVLRHFRKLTEQNVVWDRGERLWRRRESYDEEGTRITS